MSIEEIKASLSRKMRQYRYIHSLGVMETCVALAETYGVHPFKARLAGLLHDCAKNNENEYMRKYGRQEMKKEFADYPAVLHSHLGAVVAEKEYGVKDPQILNAIRYHTTGRPAMTTLEKIVLVADMIEPNRRYEGIEGIRQIVYSDLDEAVFLSVNYSLMHVVSSERVICIDTVLTRNYYAKKREREISGKTGNRKKSLRR